jgi:hypothetical protein
VALPSLLQNTARINESRAALVQARRTDSTPGCPVKIEEPQNLEQPILPGWILGSVVHIDEQNSAAPEVEAAVLREQSYGRQLGQIMDALQVLIDERGEAGRVRNPYIDKFTAMKRDIDHIKAQTAAARVQQLGTDLAILKNQDRAQYDRLRAEILHQLGE